MPMAGGLAIALFGWWLWREGTTWTGAFAIAIVALLCIPELWYSSLYYTYHDAHDAASSRWR